MDRKTLIFVSILTDTLDILVIGQIPGVGTIVDLPAAIMHFIFAGPAALVTLFDMVPAIGILPIFTVMAFAYSKD